MYILLCGEPPFWGKTDRETFILIEYGELTMDKKEWKQISEKAKDLLRKILVKDPDKRVSALQCLEHDWIKSFADTEQDLTQINFVLSNMKNFQAKQKFQEAAWNFIVNYLSSIEEKNKLLQVFNSLDTNSDGVLSKEELIVGLF